MNEEESDPLLQPNNNYSHGGSYEELPVSESDISSEVPNQPSKWKKVIGMAFALTSAIIYATISFCIKLWNVNPTDILILRAVIQTLGVTIYIKGEGGLFFPDVSDHRDSWTMPLYILLYSLCVGWSFLGSLISIKMLPLGDAVTLLFMSPVFTAIIARIFRGVAIKAFQTLFIIVIVVGIIFITQPPSIFELQIGHDFWYFIGALIAFSAALSIATLYNLLGGPLKNVPVSILFFYMGITCLLIAIVSSQLDKHCRILSQHIGEITEREWLTLVAIVLCGMGALYINIKAFQMAHTVVVTILKCIEIPISYSFQIYAMQQVPNALGGVGAGLVLASVAIIPCESLILRAIPDTVRLKKFL